MRRCTGSDRRTESVVFDPAAPLHLPVDEPLTRLDPLDLASLVQIGQMSQRLAQGEPALEMKQRGAEDLVGDLIRAARLVPNHLEDRAQAPIVVTGNDAGSLGPLLEWSSVPRQDQARVETFDDGQGVQELSQWIGLCPATEIDVRRDGGEEVIA